MQLGTQTTMYAQELLVHDGRQWQGTERLHTCIVHFLGVFVLAFQLEGEVVCQMSAFVVSAEEP